MKTFVYVINFIVSSVCINAIAMEEQHLSFHKATQSDVASLLKVINEQAIKDSTKIVILPKKFRQSALKKDIAKNRLYCVKKHELDGPFVYESDEVVAFKKLFIIDDAKEYKKITQDEIRCHDEKSQLVDAHILCNPKQNSSFFPPFDFNNSVSIYSGGDYTVPSYCNRGINAQLTKYAFDDIKNDIIKAMQIQNPHPQNIVLFYGLTKTNSGEGEGGKDRNPSIIRAFKLFAKEIAAQTDHHEDVVPCHIRYAAYMPTSDPEATECKPLPDDQAIEWYGNVLLFQLVKKIKNFV